MLQSREQSDILSDNEAEHKSCREEQGRATQQDHPP
jgi:hypothetical protein